MTHMKHFHLVTFFDLTLILNFTLKLKVHIYMLPFYPLGSLLAKFGFAVVISSVSVTDKAKSNNFNLWPDMTCNPFNSFFLIPFKVPDESFRLPPRAPRYGCWFTSY